MLNPLKVKQTMDQSEIFRDRGKSFDVDIQQMGKISNIKDFMFMNIRAGDLTAVYGGGYIMYRYLTQQKGLSSEEAFDQVENFSERSQQSTLPTNMSLAQKDKNPLIRGMVMFRSSPFAMINVSLQEVNIYRNGPRTQARWNKMMQALAIQNIVIPALYNVVMQGQRAAIVGTSFVAIPFVGDAITLILTSLFNMFSDDDDKEKLWEPSLDLGLYEFAGDFMREIAVLGENSMNGEINPEDWMNVISTSIEATTGIPVDTPIKILDGFTDIGDGDVEVGALKMMGFTDNQIETFFKRKEKALDVLN